MSIVKFFECDMCGKRTEKPTDWNPEWFNLSLPTLGIFQKVERHFCTFECLENWIKDRVSQEAAMSREPYNDDSILGDEDSGA